MQHYLHQYFKYSPKYLKIINSNSIYFSWKFFFLNFFYSINHKMILESFLFFNIYVTAITLTYHFIPMQGMSQVDVVKTYSYGILVAHIINCFLFYHLYVNRLNYYFYSNKSLFEIENKIKPLGFENPNTKGSIEIFALINTFIIFIATNLFIFGCYFYLKLIFFIYSKFF